MAGLCLLNACHKTPSVPGAGTPAAEWAEVQSAPSGETHEFPFISSPFHESVLSFRTSGQIVRLETDPGKRIAAGQEIAALDDRDYRIELDRCQASLELADSEYRRVSRLYQTGNLSASVYEKARAERAIAEANYKACCNRMSYTRLTAPFSGYLQQVYSEPWQEVTAGTPIVSFIELDRLRIETSIPESLALILSRINPATIRTDIEFDALPGQHFSASGYEITRSTTRNNVSFLFTAILDNRENRFPGGMSGKIRITVPKPENGSACSVPPHCIFHGTGTGTFVWKAGAASEPAVRTPVRIISAGGREAIVCGELKPGDRIAQNDLTGTSGGAATDNHR